MSSAFRGYCLGLFILAFCAGNNVYSQDQAGSDDPLFEPSGSTDVEIEFHQASEPAAEPVAAADEPASEPLAVEPVAAAVEPAAEPAAAAEPLAVEPVAADVEPAAEPVAAAEPLAVEPVAEPAIDSDVDLFVAPSLDQMEPGADDLDTGVEPSAAAPDEPAEPEIDFEPAPPADLEAVEDAAVEIPEDFIDDGDYETAEPIDAAPALTDEPFEISAEDMVFEQPEPLPDQAAETPEPSGAGDRPWWRFWSRGPAEAEEPDALVEEIYAEIPDQEAEPAAGIGAPGELPVADRYAIEEEVRRQAFEVEALNTISRGDKAMMEGRYAEAVKLYGEALAKLPRRPHTVELSQNIKVKQGECEYRQAENLYREDFYNDARDAARRALGYDPGHKDAMRLLERIEAVLRRPPPPPPPPAKAPEFLEDQKAIRASLRLGRQYMAIGEYEKARTEFRRVLAQDQYNAEAGEYWKRLAELEYARNTKTKDATEAAMISAVRDKWTARVSMDAVTRDQTPGPGVEVRDQRRTLLEKLNRITLRELNFRQANIIDVIKFLDTASIEEDKESPPNERGVNFILNLKRPGEGSVGGAPSMPSPEPSTEDDLFGLPSMEQDSSTTLGISDIPLITLQLRNILLMDAIRYITEVTNLKYRIEDNAVVITPADVVYGEVVTRIYSVQPSFVDIIQRAPDAAPVDDFGLSTAATTSTVTGDVRSFFTDAGVPFPEGTSILYKASISKLIVSNTPENLEKFERILSQLNVVPNQVEIEARFVEVSQEDLEEIGMEWLLTDNWEVATRSGQNPLSPIASRERVQVNRSDFTRGLRYLGATGTEGLTPRPGQSGGTSGGLLSISSVLTNPEISFILHALEQRTGANLLSAPKVTTKSGQNAEIKVVQELIYPTEFTQSVEQLGGTGEAAQTRVVTTPGGFNVRDVGVTLNVTPTVSPDGYTIDLTMMPQVVELAGWINYGQITRHPDGTSEETPMPQPIFRTRTIATSISIWDGQTVVMGGLINEVQMKTRDRIPVLGSIPLLGRAFRSDTERSQKKNLLIFVGARLVDPSGRPILKDQASLAPLAPEEY